MLAHVAASRRWVRLPLAALVALALAGPAPRALAVSLTFFVTITTDTADGNCNFDCSLREAIDAANANPGADRIEVPQGTYVLTISGASEDLNASGDLDLREDVTIVGSGADKVIITLGGDTDDRVLQIVPGVTATISGLTLAGGKAGAAPGGAIYSQGVLTLANSVVRNSSGASGGGIASSGFLTLTNVTVKDNVSAGAGGGVASQAPLVVGGSTFSGNQAGGSGGGISASAPVGITTSAVVGNIAGGSGGGISASAALTLGDTTLSENQAAGSGGGIQSAGQLSITAGTLAGNSAGASGGGISSSGSATLTNVTISANSAGSGGGLANSGSATLASLTLANNSASAGNGGGLLNSPGKSMTLKNSIVANNSGATAPDCAGTITSQGHNLLGVVGPTCVLGAATGDLLNRDPQLGALRDNGGPTPTRALLAGSPALDAGSPAAAGAAGACPMTDQRGVSRPQTGRCDIGAFELAGVAIVDFAFQPANLVVKAGTTVRWKNLGAADHATKSDNPVGAEPWNSPLIAPGEVFMRTFNTAGSYSYFCTVHQSMTGTITVLGPSVSPAPLLTSIDPSSAPAGSPELILTLTGLNFDVDATVDWGGVSLEVLSRSDQQFQAKVPAALLASAGVVSVRVVNPQATGGPTNALTFRIIAGAPDHQLFVPLARNGT